VQIFDANQDRKHLQHRASLHVSMGADCCHKVQGGQQLTPLRRYML